VYARAEVVVGSEETADELRRRLGALGDEMLLKALAAGLPEPEPQRGEPTYAAKVSVDELRLDFSAPAVACQRVVRVGRAWTTWRGKRLVVHSARVLREDLALSPGQIHGNDVGTGDGALRLLVVQPEAKAAMGAAEWARGARLHPGEVLGA
jgi:methionyl-tRNA formyltransferase